MCRRDQTHLTGGQLEEKRNYQQWKEERKKNPPKETVELTEATKNKIEEVRERLPRIYYSADKQRAKERLFLEQKNRISDPDKFEDVFAEWDNRQAGKFQDFVYELFKEQITLEQKLNNLGQDGWELVSIHGNNLVLKRPKDPNAFPRAS